MNRDEWGPKCLDSATLIEGDISAMHDWNLVFRHFFSLSLLLLQLLLRSRWTLCMRNRVTDLRRAQWMHPVWEGIGEEAGLETRRMFLIGLYGKDRKGYSNKRLHWEIITSNLIWSCHSDSTWHCNGTVFSIFKEFLKWVERLEMDKNLFNLTPPIAFGARKDFQSMGKVIFTTLLGSHLTWPRTL